MPFDASKTRREFKIPDELQEGAFGVSIVTLKIPGGGRADKIRRHAMRTMFAQMDELGDRFDKMLDRHAERTEAGEVEKDPEKLALAEYPPRAVCEYCIYAMDGDKVSKDQVDEWLEAATQPVIEWVALAALRWGGLVDETKEQEGNA